MRTRARRSQSCLRTPLSSRDATENAGMWLVPVSVMAMETRYARKRLGTRPRVSDRASVRAGKSCSTAGRERATPLASTESKVTRPFLAVLLAWSFQPSLTLAPRDPACQGEHAPFPKNSHAPRRGRDSEWDRRSPEASLRACAGRSTTTPKGGLRSHQGSSGWSSRGRTAFRTVGVRRHIVSGADDYEIDHVVRWWRGGRPSTTTDGRCSLSPSTTRAA